MNHAVYQAGLKSRSREQLDYIIKDAGEAIRANPESHNVGYYADEIHYASMEIERRRTKRGAKRNAKRVDAIMELLG
jgi:hypothetical protein